MGSNDIPPPHIPAHVVPISGFFLQIGGALWTLSYILYVRQSLADKTYGMPLFALACNFAWEFVYALYVVESRLEAFAFTVWLIVDIGLVYGLLKYGSREWAHAPWVARHLGSIFWGMVVVCVWGHWAFARWWIDENINSKQGKFYGGIEGPDTTELGFWSAGFSQITLSVMSLCMLLTRSSSRGVGWGVWATRAIGSLVGFYLPYGWNWWFWTEAHEYFMSPIGVFIWLTCVLADTVYGVVLFNVKQREAQDASSTVSVSNGKKKT